MARSLGHLQEEALGQSLSRFSQVELSASQEPEHIQADESGAKVVRGSVNVCATGQLALFLSELQ
jgi:hypothetical protein